MSDGSVTRMYDSEGEVLLPSAAWSGLPLGRSQLRMAALLNEVALPYLHNRHWIRKVDNQNTG